MNKAVVTIAIGDAYTEIAKLTHPSIKAYAERIGADFICISASSGTPHWEKFQIHELLIKYRRIIYLDTDMIIRDDCPNLFAIVPEFQLGIFNEGRFDSRFGSLQEAFREYNKPFPAKWDGTYYNTGVMVLSRRHRFLFKLPSRIASLGMYEQGYLNMQIQTELDTDRTHEERICELDYKFNRMTLTDSHCGIHRCDSYIIHYAGAPPQIIARLVQEDIATWERYRPAYQFERNIVIYMGGGMGDQLGAEPVARFTMDHMFKDVKTNFCLVTNWPRFFTHLNVPCMERTVYEANPRYDTPVKVLKTIPAPDESSLWENWSHISGHTLDYAAINAIHRILPDDCREIHLAASVEGLVEIMDIAGETRGDMILVHPGRGWDSKTFPAEWWEGVVKGLVDAGKHVGVIGQQINDDQGYVDIDIPEGVVDFRNLLSLDGLIALIATSSLLISNDSAPVHIAGAFDNQILLIATCRHPDYILPYRKGSKTYKTFAFKKKLTIDDWDLSPTRIFKESADVVKGSILDYLPTPAEVVQKAVEMHGSVPKTTFLDAAIDTIPSTQVPYDCWNAMYEPEVSGFFKNHLRPGDNVIDVGANLGMFTMLAHNLVGDSGIVCAFEPEKYTFNRLKNHVNGNGKIRLFNNAVGDKNADVPIYFNMDNDGGHALWNPAHHPLNKSTKQNESIVEIVPMVTLDSVIDFIPKLFKIDTEGCELMVLKGAERLLRDHHPAVVSEINTFALKEMGTTQVELNDYMASLGYKAYSLPDEKELDLANFNAPFLNYNMVFMAGEV